MYSVSAHHDPAALLRIRLTYLFRHGRLPDLRRPRLFTELVQCRKLHDRDPRLPIMADKVAVKAIVAERLGREWVVPTLWSGSRLPERLPWEQPIVVKSRHGCNQTIVVRGDEDRWAVARRLGHRWVKTRYGGWLDEWLYTQIERGLLIEPFIGIGPELPLDYKIYVFHGRASYVQVHLDRATDHRWIVHDRDWRPVAGGAERITPPSALSAMLEAAEELAKDFSFARVDFYQPAAQPLFGEMTFYPGSGLDPFDPPELDAAMGALWLAAPLSTECTRPEAPVPAAAPAIAA